MPNSAVMKWTPGLPRLLGNSYHHAECHRVIHGSYLLMLPRSPSVLHSALFPIVAILDLFSRFSNFPPTTSHSFPVDNLIFNFTEKNGQIIPSPSSSWFHRDRQLLATPVLPNNFFAFKNSLALPMKAQPPCLPLAQVLPIALLLSSFSTHPWREFLLV